MRLEELRIYTLSMEMGEKVWNIVVGWNYFEKDTVGKQLVRAVDSVAENLSEGFGRYHYKETINFSRDIPEVVEGRCERDSWCLSRK